VAFVWDSAAEIGIEIPAAYESLGVTSLPEWDTGLIGLALDSYDPIDPGNPTSDWSVPEQDARKAATRGQNVLKTSWARPATYERQLDPMTQSAQRPGRYGESPHSPIAALACTSLCRLDEQALLEMRMPGGRSVFLFRKTHYLRNFKEPHSNHQGAFTSGKRGGPSFRGLI
jgi:hypothetical protein